MALRLCGSAVLPTVIVLLPLVIGVAGGSLYPASYGHFLELLWAKVIWLNQKPMDPAVLTFGQRILWTPALHSATLELTSILFTCTLPLFFLALVICLWNTHWRSDPDLGQLLVYNVISLLAFVLFVRFHVFTAVFLAALLGWLAGWAVERRGWRGGIVLVLVMGGVAAEAAHTLDRPSRWGSTSVYLPQQQELAAWVREHVEGDPILANFGVSAFLLAYGGCPIVLHPKFESPGIRARVQAYGEALFKSDEAGFRDWADREGARYYVHSLGEFAPVHPEWQMRYFVDALEPPPDAAARLLEFNPSGSRYFIKVWDNHKYRVFRIVTRAEEQSAARLAVEARAALDRDTVDEAGRLATLALAHDPNSRAASRVLLDIESRRGKGPGR